MSSSFSGPYKPALPPPSPNIALGFNKSTFTYEELAAATEGFSQANLLGQGGFGYVHKGVLPNGQQVAVKSLKVGSGQGEREFQAEVEIISRVHHRHLVSLVGYCIAGAQRMLVYEFVPNKTLEYHLYGMFYACILVHTKSTFIVNLIIGKLIILATPVTCNCEYIVFLLIIWISDFNYWLQERAFQLWIGQLGFV